MPPLLCSRLARGGKSTTLCLIFEELKKHKICPIFITFNGSSTFLPRQGETQCAAILRMVALQLVDLRGIDAIRIVCNEDYLDDYLGAACPVVLLIDELNALAAPIDEDAGRMLRRLFLDKPNRYLLFSSHVPLNVDPIASHYILSPDIPPSSRGCHVLDFTPCIDVLALRAMSSKCSSLSPSEVSLYCGIPSLIYSVKALRERTPALRFAERFAPGCLRDDIGLLADFVATILDGFRRPRLRCFEQYGVFGKDERMRWPLCYIECILSAFSLPQDRKSVV